MKLLVKDFLFTAEILNGKLHFLSSVYMEITKMAFLTFEHPNINMNWLFFNFLITLHDTEVGILFETRHGI